MTLDFWPRRTIREQSSVLEAPILGSSITSALGNHRAQGGLLSGAVCASPEQDDLRVRPPLCGNETPSAFPSTWNVFTVGLLPGTYGLNLAAFQRAIKTENCTTSRYPSLPTAVSLRKCQGFARHLCVQSQLPGTEQGVGVKPLHGLHLQQALSGISCCVREGKWTWLV